MNLMHAWVYLHYITWVLCYRVLIRSSTLWLVPFTLGTYLHALIEIAEYCVLHSLYTGKSRTSGVQRTA